MLEMVLNTNDPFCIILFILFTINKTLEIMLLWLKERLTEKSTYQGLIGFLGAVGITINPEMVESVVALAVSLISVIEIVRKEKATPNDQS